MSSREIAIDLIRKLPDDVSLHEIAREIEFIAHDQEGFEQLETGEGVSAYGSALSSWLEKGNLAS